MEIISGEGLGANIIEVSGFVHQKMFCAPKRQLRRKAKHWCLGLAAAEARMCEKWETKPWMHARYSPDPYTMVDRCEPQKQLQDIHAAIHRQQAGHKC